MNERRAGLPLAGPGPKHPVAPVPVFLGTCCSTCRALSRTKQQVERRTASPALNPGLSLS